jgi:short-subunit dehydrogenase
MAVYHATKVLLSLSRQSQQIAGVPGVTVTALPGPTDTAFFSMRMRAVKATLIAKWECLALQAVAEADGIPDGQTGKI